MANTFAREHFILPMDHPISVENIRRHLSVSQKWDNIFSKSELNEIWKQAFHQKRTPRMNRNGTVIIAGALDEIYIQYKEKIDKLLGPFAERSPNIGGNFFLTPQQYGLHNDSDTKVDIENTIAETPFNHERRRYTCWKNFIIPLWIGTHHAEVDGGQLCFFNQRHIDWAHVYNHGNHTKNIASIYPITTNYEEIQFYDQNGHLIPKENNSIPFDKKVYDDFLNTPYERVTGLTLENAFDWVPGMAMSFDAVQLHSSNEGTKSKQIKTWNAKMGLLLTYLIELDDDLLIDWRKEQRKM